MEFLLYLAEKAGIRKQKIKNRFAEQAWLLVYYSATYPLGLVSALRARGLLQLTDKVHHV